MAKGRDDKNPHILSFFETLHKTHKLPLLRGKCASPTHTHTTQHYCVHQHHAHARYQSYSRNYVLYTKRVRNYIVWSLQLYGMEVTTMTMVKTSTKSVQNFLPSLYYAARKLVLFFVVSVHSILSSSESVWYGK